MTGSAKHTAFAAVLSDLGSIDADGWVQIVPMGTFTARDGRGPFLLRDRAHADQVVAATKAFAAGQDLVIDYDHQSEHALKLEGGVAPAAAWMQDFQVRDDGIYARTEWTPLAQQKRQDREYRYLSPVFTFAPPAKPGGPLAVLKIMRAGLTNNPALSDLAAVAAQEPVEQEDQAHMTKKIAVALGLTETATEAEILAGIAALSTAQASVKAIAKAAGLGEDADGQAICAAVKTAVEAGEPDPTKYAPLSVVTGLQEQVAALTASDAKAKAEAAVDAATEAGKLAPANRAWALSYAERDLAGFATFVAGAPAILSAAKPARAAAEGEIVLTDEEKAVCAMTGVSEADFIATRKEELAA